MKSTPLPPCDHAPAAYSGPSADEVLALRKQFLSPALFHYYRKPIMIVEGRGQWLFDEKGRRYLDGIAGIVPSVAATATRASSRRPTARTSCSSTPRRSTSTRISPSTPRSSPRDAGRPQGRLFR